MLFNTKLIPCVVLALAYNSLALPTSVEEREGGSKETLTKRLQPNPPTSCVVSDAILQLFTEWNYHGGSVAVCGDWQQCYNLWPSWNDQASSLKTEYTNGCTIWTNLDCTGASYYVDANANNGEIPQLQGTFNKAITSFKCSQSSNGGNFFYNE